MRDELSLLQAQLTYKKRLEAMVTGLTAVNISEWGLIQLRDILEQQEFYAGKGNAVHFEETLDNTAVRDLADAIADTCRGTAAVFSGSDESGYAFCLVTREGDLRQLGKEMTKALNGRGGGKPAFQQGRVQAKKAEIEAFFAGR